MVHDEDEGAGGGTSLAAGRPPRGRRRRSSRSLAVAAVAFVALAAVASGCSSEPSFDRGQAVADVRRSDPRLTEEQAGCFVDRVVAELGARALAADASPEQITRRTTIRVDCVGVAGLGTLPPGTVPRVESPSAVNEPHARGDDPTLDALYDACAAGGGSACDELFDVAPVGSEYERFASTCGGRTTETRCADIYPG